MPILKYSVLRELLRHQKVWRCYVLLGSAVIYHRILSYLYGPV